MLYFLMNKDTPVLSFINKTSTFSGDELFEAVETLGAIPLNFLDIGYWVRTRMGSSYSPRLRHIMYGIGITNNIEYVSKTHAASTNDTFWIKREDEDISWNDVSLFRTDFTKIISEYAFKGYGSAEFIDLLHSPELSCEGSFRKKFRREFTPGQYGSDIFIYKRGNDSGEECACSFEPYSEMLASEIANIISPNNAVKYDLCYVRNAAATKCSLFTSEKNGFVTYRNARTVDSHALYDIWDYYKSHGFEQQLREMLVIDSLCFNYDRHTSNFGFLYDTDTMEIIKPTPVFDLNNTLFPTFTVENLRNIGDRLFLIEPKIGDDFTRIGQIGLNDTIKERLEQMRGFSFSFRGDKYFTEERVELLEVIVRKQIEAVLSDKKLYTDDVFSVSK